MNQAPKIGDVVLLKDKLPHGQWRIGRIERLIKGKDQLVRAAKVRLSSKKVFTRALNMLFPIECPEHGSEVENSVNDPMEETQDRDNNENTMEDTIISDEIENDVTPMTRPTKRAVVAAREKIRNWLNPMKDNTFGAGNVAD